jgi:hypothetical protein
MMIKIESHTKLISPNRKKHHMTLHSYHKKHKESIWFLLKSQENDKPKLPAHVTMTRYSKKRFDSDNYITACKHIRDTIADFLIPGKAPGQADSSLDIYWHYWQEKPQEDKKEKLVIEII